MSAVKSPVSKPNSTKVDPVKKDVLNAESAADEQMINELSKLNQIRDMLFGEQVSALREQCQSLDKNLAKNISALRAEMRASVKELKKQIEENFDQLQKRINSEELERTGQHEQLNAELTSINSDIITKIDIETKRIDEALDEQHQESVHQLNKVANSLQDNKLDKKMLAQYFSQLAEELGGSKAK